MAKEAGRTHDPEEAREGRLREPGDTAPDERLPADETVHARRLHESEEQEAVHHAAPGRPERPDDEGPAQRQAEPPHS